MIDRIDRFLRDLSERQMMDVREVENILLDLRLLLMEGTDERKEKDGKLPERTAPLVGADHSAG
jgi:hypothetical protein